MWCYARLLAHYPYVIMTAVLVVLVSTLIVTITLGESPSFEEPMIGFEPRGTEISDRITTLTNLVNDPELSPLPQKAEVIMQRYDNQLVVVDSAHHGNITTYRTRRSRTVWWEPYFCDVPDGRYIKLVYHSPPQADLFTVTGIKNMCQLEERFITNHPIYTRNCLHKDDHTSCCRTLSLGNYVALLTRKKSCTDIDEEDVSQVRNLVQACVKYYHNYSLAEDCDYRHSRYGANYTSCKQIPKRCQKFNAVYNIMHFIADHSFLRVNDKLSYAISFLPISFQSTTNKKLADAIQLFLDIESSAKKVGIAEIVAADFGIKDELFQHYLSKDSKWLTVSGTFIFFIVWIFTGSIFVTFMSFITMFWSIELAYFLYIFVFKINFFPYMNLVTVLMVIAIGADDVFVYSKIWHLAKKERNNGTLEKLVSDTLKHASLSMVVTSLTTAGALFSNIVSPITSIKCFSLYAGTSMCCNLVLMVTWMPASIVVQERWCNLCFINSPKIYKKLRSHYRCFFERLIPKFVLHLRFLWILLLSAIGIVSGVLVFYYPKLRLPTSFRFQVFRGDHLMEMYDQELRENFWFERSVGENRPLMPITIVWGVIADDQGDHLDPHDKGSLLYDRTFNPSTPHAQKWLLHFCTLLREQEFYRKVTAFEMNNCYIDHFVRFMASTSCSNDPICCKSIPFPYNESVFNTCIKKYIPLLVNSNTYTWDKNEPGIKFSGNKISALVVQFSSNLTYTYDYETISSFYKQVNSWVSTQIHGAPAEMRNGWFISELKFFSIQKSLAEGLPVAFTISIMVAAAVTFFTCLNVMITIYAMITITFIMLVTTASIVLLGWELNILESVIITVAVGLSIDHTLHYAVAYRLAPDLDRQNRAYCSLVRVGSVIFVAAGTTFIAGAFMLPSVTLVYQKFGIFLMLVISISWVYSTLFFQSLLNVIGPQGGFGQFHWPSLDCCSLLSHSHTDRTVYTMSESTMSTSSSGYPYHPSIDTNATEHEFLPERGSDSNPGTPHHYRSRPGRSYQRHKSESTSPDCQSQRKLLTNEDRSESERPCNITVEVYDPASHREKLCTEV